MGVVRSDEGFNIRRVLPMLVLDVACPYLTYHYLIRFAPAMSPALALVLSGTFPVLANVLSLMRSRTLDIIGVVVLVGIGVGAVTAFMSGDARMVLLRESFVTGALAIVCLASLWWPRPLLFFIGRDFSTGHDPARVAQFNALWELPGARRTFRVMTAVRGAGWIAGVAIKIALVLTLSIPQVLVVGPIESWGITAALIWWTLRYARDARARRQGAQA